MAGEVAERQTEARGDQAQLGDGRHGQVSFFFFQAEDGIRDYKVTGVQTCALPIFRIGQAPARLGLFGQVQAVAADVVVGRIEHGQVVGVAVGDVLGQVVPEAHRSGERRVGEEGRSRWSPYHLKKKKKRK